MKQRAIIGLFCLLCSPLFAQHWVIDYEGVPSGVTAFADAVMDEEGVTFLVGQEGESHEKPETLVMRVEPNGEHVEYLHHKAGCYTKGTCILELQDHRLFIAGNCQGPNDDSVMVLILDKQLNLIHERYYPKEVEALSFGKCQATLDAHGQVIVASSVRQSTPYPYFENHGVFFKFDTEGRLVSHRYLIEDYPNPLFYFSQFHLRQMWYRDDETLLCLAPGYGGVMSFITFDSAFNYIEEHPLYQENGGHLDVLCDDCYTDYWFNEDEALVFSSNCDGEHSELRVAHVNTQGEFLQYMPLHVRPDTLDEVANRRCMAAVNDSTFYFSFYYHRYPYDPGVACVYLLNDRLDIVGRHLDDDVPCYRSKLILPTPDGGCLAVNGLCNCVYVVHEEHPYLHRLSRDDFETVVWSVSDKDSGPATGLSYPNPTNHLLHIPLDLTESDELRCQVVDLLGRIVSDQRIGPSKGTLHLNVAHLRPGTYHYRIYTSSQTLLTERFIKQ